MANPNIDDIVTIVGSEVNPSEFLPGGQTMTVRWTEHAQNLLDDGNITIIEHPEIVKEMIVKYDLEPQNDDGS